MGIFRILLVAGLIGWSLEESCAATLKVNASVYGFIKASMMSAKRTSKDYKPFFAEKNVTGVEDYDDDVHSQLTTRQSRLGVKVEQDKVIALFEWDFDGESGNTSGVTTSSTGNIRTRLLEVRYKPSEFSEWRIGKKWDLFYAVSPYTYAITLAQLFQGNTGFLTEGVEYSYQMGRVRVSAQLQTLGDIPSYKVSVPVPTVRIEHQVGGSSFYGLAVKAGEIKTEEAKETQDNVTSTGAKLYSSVDIGRLSLTSEIYKARNLGATTTGGSLSNLGTGTVSDATGPAGVKDDLDEAGYFLSVCRKFHGWGLFAGLGYARIDDSETSLQEGAIQSNRIYRLGADADVEEGLKVFFEISNLQTSYVADDFELEKVNGGYLDIGMLYKF